MPWQGEAEQAFGNARRRGKQLTFVSLEAGALRSGSLASGMVKAEDASFSSRGILHPGGLRVAKNAKQPPANIAVDIVRAVTTDQETAAFGFLKMEQNKAAKAAEQEEAARYLQEVAAVALAEAIEAARPKKAADAPSRQGGFQERSLQMVPVGGASMKYAGSMVATQVVELEAEMLATRILPGLETKALYGATVVEPPALGDREAGDRGSISFLDTQGLEAEGEEATGEESAEAAEARQEKRSSLDSQYPNMAPPGTDGDTPVTMPPRAQRMSQSVPKDVYGNDRASKVLAPEVSLTAATANPNMRNLLLEVPYKRGVRTTSVNQRYLTHEQTFDAAFVRSPSSSPSLPPSPSPVYPSTPPHTLPHPHLPRHRPHRLLCRPRRRCYLRKPTSARSRRAASIASSSSLST